MLIQGLVAFVVLASSSTNGSAVRGPASAISQLASAAPNESVLAVGHGAGQTPIPTSTSEPQRKPPDVIAPDEEIEPDQAVDDDEKGRHFVWKQHPSIRFGDVFRLDFQSKLQEDAHGSYPGAPGLNCQNSALPSTCLWELHRNRVGIEGYLFKRIEYEVERELTEQELTEKEVLAGYSAKSVWKDVAVNISYINNFQVQAGRFKIPFSLDELTGDSHNDFVYRSLGANYLAPARDTGVMLHGRFLKRALNYWVGGFKHDGDNARSKKIEGGNETYAARISGTPLRKFSPGLFGALEFGTALAVTSLSDDSFYPNGLRGRTVLTQDTFYEPVYVKGHRHRWEGDVDWTIGPASARSEFTWVTDDRLQQGLGDQSLPDARARAWYVPGTWILTGEPKTRPVKAENELLRGGFGAVEVAARFERLWFDSVDGVAAEAFRNPRTATILPSGEKALTLGVSWTLNRWIKVQFNGIRERVEDPETNPISDGKAFWSRVVRFQFVL